MTGESKDGKPLRDLDPARLEALIEMMFLAVHADGEFDDRERNAFATQVRALSDGKVSGEAFKTLMARIEKQVAADGRAARIASLKTAFPDAASRQEALSLVVRMVAADGVIRTSERELVLEVAEGLEIDGAVAADLVRASGV
jgi:uncharacterized tellurite resistance protein B-like protein